MLILNILLNVFLGFVLLLLATIVFDVVHVLLHTFSKSSHRVLRVLGQLHLTHHQFLDNNLQIEDDLIIDNVWRHVVPEFILQVIVTLLFSIYFPSAAVIVALTLEFGVFIFIMWDKPGIDVNHHNVDQLKAYRPLLFCVPEYHLLHHVYPTAYFSSWIKLLDYLLCTGTALQNRHIIITAINPFTKAFSDQLIQHGAHVKTIDSVLDLSNLDTTLDTMQQADILVLCHDPKSGSNYDELTQKFYERQQTRRVPVEVWALSFNDIEANKHARKWFFSEKVIYRMLVVSDSKMDARCAKKLLAGIRRGFNYVPKQWSIKRFKNYLQFVLK